MRVKPKEVYLLKSDVIRLRKFCKGCQYFKPEKPVRSICSIIGWSNIRNIQAVIDSAKPAPCNTYCLIKASCREEQCPIWLDYVYATVEERDKKLMRKK